MKKKLSMVLALALVVAMATVCLVACGPTVKTGVGYAYQDGNVVVAEVKTTDGKITSVVINEVEGLMSIANVKKLNGTVIADADKFVVSEGSRGVTAVKKVKVGDKTFVMNETAKVYELDGVTFEKWCETAANLKYFVEQVRAGKYDVLKADGTAYAVPYTLKASEGKTDKDLTKGQRWEKRLNEYWKANPAVPTMGQGWVANADKIADYVVKNGFIKANVTEANTGASFGSFPKYVAAVELAVNAAK